MADDDDNFEEDGCTMDFSDEMDPSPGTMATIAGPVTYRHYEGEDFAQYLNDDDEDLQHNHWCSERAPGGIPADDRTYSRRRLSTANIREKLGRLLLPSANGRSRNSTLAPQQNLNRIYDVSFADCKMGSVDRPTEGSVLGSDSGIDCRSRFSLETESDLGAQASSAWSDMDSSLSPSKRRPSSSTSAIDLSRSVADYSSNGSGREQRRLDRSEVGPNGSNVAAASRELGSARKASDPGRTDGPSKLKLTNSFRKIYNTLSRRKSANLQHMSYDQDSEDIRL